MAQLSNGSKKDGRNDEKATTATNSTTVVPSADDRRKMLHAVSIAVNATVAKVCNRDSDVFKEEDSVIGSSVHSNKSSSVQQHKKISLAEERHQRRVKAVLLEKFLPSASDALLLTDEKGNRLHPIGDNDNEIKLPNDVFGCVSLLLLNTILLSKEDGYDARIRHIIRSVSIDLIAKKLIKQEKNEHITSTKSQNSVKGVFHVENLTAEGGDEPCPEYNEEPLLTPEDLTDYLDSAYEEEKSHDSERNIHTNAADSERSNESEITPDDLPRHVQVQAAKKFEAIESAVASVLMLLLLSSKEQQNSSQKDEKMSSDERNKNIIRGVKIGAAGLAAGALFAVTGGLAAPGIVAGLASIGIGGSAVIALTHTATIAAVFGVYGGNLAAQKMRKRTEGLTEFVIRKEEAVVTVDTEKALDGSSGGTAAAEAVVKKVQRAELHSTVCVSGWLYDMADFQRPWGVTPTDPPLEMLETLERFFAVYHPERGTECPTLLEMYGDDYGPLFKTLRQQYGRDPDHLLPLDGVAERLTDDEKKKIFDLSTVCMNSDVKQNKLKKSGEYRRKKDVIHTSKHSEANSVVAVKAPTKQSSQAVSKSTKEKEETPPDKKQPSQFQGFESIMAIPSSFHHTNRTVWDYQSQYGGGVYTITWESEMLLKVCNYMNDAVAKLTKKATKEVLKQTALATLISAVAWPSMIKTFADMIDEPWTIASIRSDEAGVELARCLVESDERQPVTLVGYSFGARTIFSCLNELARLQEEWEDDQVKHSTKRKSSPSKNSSSLQDVQVAKNVTNEKLKVMREPASIVENVVLMGSPTYTDRKAWTACRRIVAGRLINCYSRKDWILSLMFQVKSTTGIFRRTAGTYPIEDVAQIENVDCSDLVGGSHGDYCMVVYNILDRAGFGCNC